MMRPLFSMLAEDHSEREPRCRYRYLPQWTPIMTTALPFEICLSPEGAIGVRLTA